jgi:hypothetical protein
MIEALEPVAKAQWTFTLSSPGLVVELALLVQNWRLGMLYAELFPYSCESLSTFV